MARRHTFVQAFHRRLEGLQIGSSAVHSEQAIAFHQPLQELGAVVSFANSRLPYEQDRTFAGADISSRRR